jgi:hypothetical protein
MTSPEQKRIISLSPAQIGPVSYISLADLLVDGRSYLLFNAKPTQDIPFFVVCFLKRSRPGRAVRAVDASCQTHPHICG